MSDLQWYIDAHEEEFLRLLLGDALYTAYAAGLAEDPVPAKWTALRNKLFQANATSRISPAANYVFFKFYREKASHATGLGEAKPNAQNSLLLGNAQKCKVAWSAMAKMNQNIKFFIEANAADYPEYVAPELSSTDAGMQLYRDRTNILKTAIPYF
jgi:hypothetical protein